MAPPLGRNRAGVGNVFMMMMIIIIIIITNSILIIIIIHYKLYITIALDINRIFFFISIRYTLYIIQGLGVHIVVPAFDGRLYVISGESGCTHTLDLGVCVCVCVSECVCNVIPRVFLLAPRFPVCHPCRRALVRPATGSRPSVLGVFGGGVCMGV
jgi:hypothetical protein